MDKEKLLVSLRELQRLGEAGVRGDDLADKIRALIHQIEGTNSADLRGAAYGDR